MCVCVSFVTVSTDIAGRLEAARPRLGVCS